MQGDVVRNTDTRLDNVDLLRAISIVMVLFFHYTTRFDPSYYNTSSRYIYFPWGHYGVDIFFSVSGFCILMTLSRSKSLSDFLSKRISRIQPAYMLAVILTFFTTSVFGLPGREVGWIHAIGNLVWLEAVPGWPMVDSVYWSLVVEIKFYVVIGLIYCLAKGREISFKFSILVLLASLMTIFSGHGRIGSILASVSSFILLYPFSPMFLLGLVAWESRAGWEPKLVAAATIALVSLGVSPRFGGEPLLGSGIGVLVFLTLKGDNIRIPRFISYVGLISYSLYLFHQNIGLVIIRQTSEFGFSFGFRIFLACCITTALAVITFETIELRWRRHFSIFFYRIFSLLLDRIPVFVLPKDGSQIAKPVEISL